MNILSKLVLKQESQDLQVGKQQYFQENLSFKHPSSLGSGQFVWISGQYEPTSTSSKDLHALFQSTQRNLYVSKLPVRLPALGHTKTTIFWEAPKIGRFLKVLGNNFFYKSSQNTFKLCGLWFNKKVLQLRLGATFVKNWATFNSNKGSHCQTCVLLLFSFRDPKCLLQSSEAEAEPATSSWADGHICLC